MSLHSETLNIHQKGELIYITFPLFDRHGVRLAFTTR